LNKQTENTSKKQPTQFVITNHFIGTKNLNDILAKIALSEVNDSERTNTKNEEVKAQ
jgi:hypothetical protein